MNAYFSHLLCVTKSQKPPFPACLPHIFRVACRLGMQGSAAALSSKLIFGIMRLLCYYFKLQLSQYQIHVLKN
jgi:hypothetical protein